MIVAVSNQAVNGVSSRESISVNGILRSMEPKKRGRPPKGKRAGPSAVRFEPDQKLEYEAAAENAGLPLGDYIALVMAEYHGFKVPDYIVRALRAHELQRAQEEAAYPISA